MIAGYPEGSVVPVIVVGGGPVGITTAAMLAARGVQTLVLDRWPGVYPLPRAVHLDDETYRILQGVTGIEAVEPLLTPMLGLRLLDGGHRTMAEFRRDRPVGVHGHPQGNMFDQPDLESALRAHLTTLPAATLVGDVEVTAVDQAPGSPAEETWPAPVRVTVRHVHGDAREQHLYARAVLGCDGANSLVRASIGAHLLDLHFEERWFVVDVRTRHTLDCWDGVHQVCDPARAATFMRVGPGRYRWEFRLHDGESPEDLLVPERFAHLLRPWTGELPPAELSVLRSAEYTFRARIADRWRDGRVLLLGDAAHLTPPFIGQGLCAGLRDAANLSWKLAGVLDGTFAESVLDTYQAERAPHARALVRKAVRVGQAMTGGQDGAAAVRRIVLNGLCRIPGLTTAVLDAAPPAFGPDLLGTPARHGLTGALVPQPWVVVNGHRRRLDDVLGEGFSVLTRDPPGPALQRAARRLGATLVRLVDHTDPVIGGPDVLVAVESEGTLHRWLGRRRVVAAVIRPDRVVAAQTRRHDGGLALAAEVAGWTWIGSPAPG